MKDRLDTHRKAMDAAKKNARLQGREGEMPSLLDEIQKTARGLSFRDKATLAGQRAYILERLPKRGTGAASANYLLAALGVFLVNRGITSEGQLRHIIRYTQKRRIEKAALKKAALGENE